MGKGDYRISDIYQGGYSGLIPPANNYIASGSLGMTTDPRSANILQEVSTKLSMGVKNIEVTAISPESFDSMPRQHLKEVNRLAKLTGVDITLHGPLIEASGINQQGYSEPERETAERKITNALLRSHELNPDGNIPVTFHSTVSVPSSQLLPPGKRKPEEGNYKKMIVINRSDGKSMTSLEPEVEYRPGGELSPIKIIPERRIENLNSADWKNSLFQVEVNRENAERIIKDVHPIFISQFAMLQTGKLRPDMLDNNEKDQIKKVSTAFEFIEQAKLKADSLFSKAVEMAKKDNDQEMIQMLTVLSKKYGEDVGVEGNKIVNPEKYLNPKVYSEALYDLTRNLERIPPKTWVKIEDFAIDKSSQTYGNAAFEAYKKYKDKSPVLVIENPPAGTAALNTGEDIRNIVVASRKQFVSNAVKEGMSEHDAEKQAEKFIGATWDVGHINMLRGLGYSEKDVIAETERVAPYVKHVHLSDNFGMEHTELPMGMGNVPIKEMMEKLGQKGFEAKKIIEAGHWWQHFRTPPFQETLEAVGSPLYSMHMAPYWSQAPGLYQGYQGGLEGQWLPQINYETFGGGFSRLPSELGGAQPGAQGSRMSGRSME